MVFHHFGQVYNHLILIYFLIEQNSLTFELILRLHNLTESENGIFNAILKGHVDFSSDPWPSISPAAKDLVRKMLNSDPKQRLTAHEVLSKYT